MWLSTALLALCCSPASFGACPSLTCCSLTYCPSDLEGGEAAAVTAATSSSMAFNETLKAAASSMQGAVLLMHPGWLHCRTLLFDGQCFGEVAFFTEIPQLDFVRTVRYAACQHCLLC